MQPKASIELGPYQLFERIGEGGNGTVYRATGPSGPVAIKIVGDVDDASRARFHREIGTLAKLAHPSLITLLDHGVDPELGAYLVTPLLPGRDLRVVCTGHRLCPEAALLVIEPIVAATVALHAAGYVHRDLKPENAIAAPDGSIVVIDLGLAWRDDMTRHTDTGAAVGSVGYMSPEQIDGRPVDGAADVWALGVMIYEWIAGKRPFARPRPSEEAAAVMIGACSPLVAADRRAGDELSGLVASMLSSDPGRRPSIEVVARRIAEMIDWTEDRQADRAAVIADPTGYQSRIAPFRIRRLERTAREAIAAGKPFVALTACDRGLAYAPDHPALLELVAAAEAASGSSVGTAAQATSSPGPAAAAISSPGPAAAAISPPGTAVPSAPISPHATAGRGSWSPRKRWLIGAGIAVAALGVIAFAASRGSSDPSGASAPTGSSSSSGDPFAVLTPALTTTRVESHMDDRDRELVHDVVGVFGKFIDVAAKDGGAHLTMNGQPVNAKGWLQRAASQKPAEAIESVRRALALEPDWVDAQIALCVEMSAVDDDGAIAACDTALRSKPGDVVSRAARAKARLHAGHAADALLDLDRVVAADPDPRWKRLRAKARTAAGDEAGAKSDLADACKAGDSKACHSTPHP